ncbi:hypothetical protein [Vibrio diazotrophicus]|uniref:hypothetical protein n=1 Tax=Vibrio diazotrophicus TaxID=685 RepID=UPI00142D98E7|nr:hypothetical protein [Vibrio diazotrophicus]NIY92066.1 hypothetical protein [Vibrio diazotrophicus]
MRKILYSNLLNNSLCLITGRSGKSNYYDKIGGVTARIIDDHVTFEVSLPSECGFEPQTQWKHNKVGGCRVSGYCIVPNYLYDDDGEYNVKLSLSDGRDSIHIAVRQSQKTWLLKYKRHSKEYIKVPYTSLSEPFINRSDDFFMEPQEAIRQSSILTNEQYKSLLQIRTPLKNETHMMYVEDILCTDKYPKHAYDAARSINLDGKVQLKIEEAVENYRVIKRNIEAINSYYYTESETLDGSLDILGVLIETFGWEVGGTEHRIVELMLGSGKDLGIESVANICGVTIEEAKLTLESYTTYFDSILSIRKLFYTNFNAKF